MNKYKLIGLIIAVILLCAALIFKFAGGSAAVALPLLTLGVWAMIAAQTVDYKKTDADGITKKVEFARLIGGYIIAVLVSAGTVIYLIFR
ncbi:MAG: hypothetical protein HFE63_09755 [Clostridiales bacterium]|nr:hypothetical protein [Clostridiales bacterium]